MSVRAIALQPLSLLLAAAVASCGRTGLDTLDDVPSGDAVAPADDGEASAPPPAPSPVNDAPSVPEAAPPAADPCQDAAPIPCPGGGERYCVAGRYSDCPTRCSACVPGSVRVCMTTFCEYWGTQSCTADGQSFGYCVERPPPPECDDIAKSNRNSPALEQCCLDHGYCCRDDFDLNHNGDSSESIGQCASCS